MFARRTRRVPLWRRMFAGGGSATTMLLALGLAALRPDPEPPPPPPPVEPVMVLYEATPPEIAPPPVPSGGRAGSTRAPTAPTAEPQAPDDPVPLDRVELLSRVNLGALGRSTVDGAGVGIGGPLGAGAGHGPPGPPPITTDLRVLSQVHPRFPPKARQYGEEARCDLMFTVTEDGLPTGIEVSGCPEIFRASVEEAAMQWRFSPPLIRGVPSPARFQIRVRFVLR